MNVSESCSCGASFSADGDSVIRLLREWRKNHVCKPVEAADNDTLVMTSADTKTEPIGFRIDGLRVEFPDRPGYEED
jgi:hypothetical protein